MKPIPFTIHAYGYRERRGFTTEEVEEAIRSEEWRTADFGRPGKIPAIKKKNQEADVSSIEAEIDQMAYQLYGLTEEEIRIVEGETK